VLVNVLIFVFVAVAGGLGTSWYMIEKGSQLTTRTSGPWSMWVAAGRPDADPYTRAHFVRRGMLPLTTALAQTWTATTDSEGKALFSSCEYVVEGPEPNAGFWSLAVFDDKGQMIPNEAERHSFNSATVMRGPSARIEVMLARNARPGNWLPTAGAGRLALTLTIEEPRGTVLSTRTDDEEPSLLSIRRIACR